MDEQILDEDFQNNNLNGDFTLEQIKEINFLKIDANEDAKNIRHGRIALIVLVVLQIIGIGAGLMSLDEGVSTTEVLAEGAITVGIYIACIFGMNRNASAGLSTGLGLYILFQLLYMLIDTANIYRGLLMKIAIIYVLVVAIKSSFRIKKIVQKLSRLGVPQVELDQLMKFESVIMTRAKSR